MDNATLQQTRSATTVTESGSGADWDSPNNILLNDDNYAESRVGDPNMLSRTLLLSDFDFDIPAAATLRGIQLTLRYSASKTIYDETLRLLLNGSPVGQNKATELPWPQSVTTTTRGNEADLWNYNWTTPDIDHIGVAIRANGDGSARIYHAQLTLFYTDATFSDLIEQCASDLGDAAHSTWSEADITMWLIDAVADYTEHFPRRTRTTIYTVAGQQAYTLPTSFLFAATVQYNGRFLSYRARHDPNFGPDNFDIYQPHASNEDAQLIIGATPTTDQTITLTAANKHEAGPTSGDGITVPLFHHRLLKAYVRWQATMQRQSKQEASPTSNSSLLMSQLAVNTDRRHRAYLRMLAKALDANAPDSGHTIWSGDAGDGLQRTY
jgi:hypothetical protein